MKTSAICVTAAGRVNIIGDHTDYTGGLVLPMTLDMHTTIEGMITSQNAWHLTSQDDDHAVHLPLPIFHAAGVQPRWGRYVAGVLAELQKRNIPIKGFTGTVTTTIPIGSGLSSSAALEVAVARAVMAMSSTTKLSNTDMALLCQQAEHIASGVPCGIMDQLCIVAGRPNNALLIDCHSLDITHIAIPDDLQVIATYVSARALATSAYANRVGACRDIERIIGPLRLATINDLTALPSEQLQRRARHVITENQRVGDFVQALATNDHTSIGRLMLESHQSLALNYEISNHLMDAAVATEMEKPGVIGARMTGGGFGGCIVSVKRR